MKKSTTIINFIALIIVLIIFSIILWKPITTLATSPQAIKEFISQFEILAPVALITLIALQVLLAPIPGQAAGLAAGFLYGPIVGTIYSMIGLILGTYIAFILARKFGRPFVEKTISKETLKKFDHLSHKAGLITLFIIYLLPALPDDAISFIAGLTKIKIRTLVIISAIGRLPGFIILNIVGASLASNNSQSIIIIFIIFMFLSIILFLNKNKIEKLFLKIKNKSKSKKPATFINPFSLFPL